MRLLCLACRDISEVLSDGEDPGLAACPACGNTKVPADADDTVTITLTTHELRVLAIWASNWATAIKDHPSCEDSPQVIQGILDHLALYTSAALSMHQEIADLREQFGKVTVYNADGTVSDI